ncbi:MAG: hypothetical protein IJM98_09185 [Oscillospiraceae bacterium]|nr:hypothetical protein [Oscillospiraceae bacterium]
MILPNPLFHNKRENTLLNKQKNEPKKVCEQRTADYYSRNKENSQCNLCRRKNRFRCRQIYGKRIIAAGEEAAVLGIIKYWGIGAENIKKAGLL